MADVPDTMEGLQLHQTPHQDDPRPSPEYTEVGGDANTHTSSQDVNQVVRNTIREELSRFQALSQSSQTTQMVDGVHNRPLQELDSRYVAMLNDERRKLNDLQSEVQEKDMELQRINHQKDDLLRQLNESRAMLSNMRKLVVLAGRKEDKPMDDDIINKFVTLKSDILQLVRTHLQAIVMPRGVRSQNAAPELSELVIRSKVANQLWWHFFQSENLLFGLDDERNANTLKKVEEGLLKAGKLSDELVDWRSNSIRIIKGMKNPGRDQYPMDRAVPIWDKLERYCRYDRKDAGRQQLRKDLENLCRTAYDAALLFRETKIEYEWEQGFDEDSALATNNIDHEIAATTGPEPHEPHEIERVVFGGVIRGDRKTGRLSDSRTRLTQSTVIIMAPPKPERRPRGH